MAKKQATGWAALDEEDWFASELLILSEDGEMALFVPMEQPRKEAEKAFGRTVEKLVLRVVRVPDRDAPVTWYVQELRMGKRAARAYRKVAEDHEGAVLIRMTRHGESGDTGTRYTFVDEGELSDAERAEAARLIAEADDSK